MKELLHAYWLAGGKVSELRFRVVKHPALVFEKPTPTNSWHYVEAYDKGTWLPQFQCGHHHTSIEYAMNCRQILEFLRDAEALNLVS